MNDEKALTWSSAGTGKVFVSHIVIYDADPPWWRRAISWACRWPGSRWLARRWGIQVTTLTADRIKVADGLKVTWDESGIFTISDKDRSEEDT